MSIKYLHHLKLLLLLVVACLLFTSLLFTSHSSWAQLSVSPKRVIFEGRQRSQELLLLNTGDSSKTYRIHFRQLNMTEQGGFEALVEDKNAANWFASRAVRYSPRQVTLAPGMAQTVRLLVRKPKGFVAGEYRSHLTFSEMPSDDSGQNIEHSSTDQGFDFKMTPLLGMSMPIIIRQGKLSQTVEIKQPVLVGDQAIPQLNLQLHLSGEASVYGQIIASFKPFDSSQHVEIGRIKGVSVLTPLRWREVTIPLVDIPQGMRLSQGELMIRYTNLEAQNSKNKPLLSEYTLTL